MIDRETVRHVATLARLELTPEEEERLAGDLTRIVEMVDGLPEVDPAERAAAEGVSEPGPAVPDPEAPPAAGAAVVAADDPGCHVPLGDAFERNAPAVEEGHLLLPPVRHEE